MINITAIILTKNEEKNIEECILSVKDFCKRIIVIDSYSSDKTVNIAKTLGVEVYLNKFVNYATQFNWALDNTDINTEWCLRLDADERFTPLLCNEIESIIKKNTVDLNGIVLEASLFFMGRKLKYGASKKRKLMVFKFGVGRIENRRMDEHTILNDGYSIEAKNKYLHYDFKNIDVFIKKLNWYATREMQDFIEFKQGKETKEMFDKKIMRTRKKKFGVYYRFPLFLRTKLLFVYFYIFKLGFLDGREGYIYNYLYCRFYRLLVDVKIYEQQKFGHDFVETGDLK